MNLPEFENAFEVEERAAEWLERSIGENWSSEDQASLEAWLAQSPAQKVTFWRLKAAWNRTHRLTALGESAIRPTQERGRAIPAMFKFAAGFVVAAAVGLGATFYALQPQDRTYSTPVGGHELVHFADGSSIELNTNTELRARMTTDQRIVWLDKGEAYFQIKHDPAHPFIVMAGKHRVTDLGTKFSVRREPGKLRVAVVQGRVSFDATDAQGAAQVALLTPGDVATATANSISVHRTSKAVLNIGLSWRHGALVFDNTSLADAATEFNRYNHEQLMVPDSSVAKLKIYGTFRADNVNDFVQLAEAVFGLHAVNDGNRIVLSH